MELCQMMWRTYEDNGSQLRNSPMTTVALNSADRNEVSRELRVHMPRLISHPDSSTVTDNPATPSLTSNPIFGSQMSVT